MIPIRSALGRTIGFGGRTLGDEEPKYINSPETEVFHKSKVLYGLAETRQALRETGEALVVEGYMDALALAQFGFDNVVASCGTAFTEDQARVLKRYVERVILLFDGDQAGIRAAWKSAGVFLGEGLEVRVLALPDEHDPDSFVREAGTEALRARIDGAPGVVSFAREILLDRLEKREDLVRAFAYLGARVDDAIRRRALLQEAAEAFRFDEATLVRETNRLRGERRTEPVAAAPEEPQDRLGRAYLAKLLSAAVPREDHLVDAGALREPRLREVLARWRQLREEGEERPTAALLEDDRFRDLVAEVLAVEDDGSALDEVVPRMRDRVRAARGRELRNAIREAESRGDRGQVESLLRELQSLNRTGP
jgi:DNA primase